MNKTNKVSTTDARQSLESNEFIWNTDNNVEAHRYILPEVIKLLKKHNVQNVLDLGCGNGSMTKELTKHGFSVVGIDPSKSGIEQAKISGQGDYRCMSVDQPLPYELTGKFDAVVSTEVIEHLFFPRNLLYRSKEALRENKGIVIISTPYHSYIKNLAIAIFNKFDNHWHPLRDYGHIKFFSIKTLRKIFNECGLDVNCIRLVGRIPIMAKSMIFLATNKIQ